MRNGLFKKIVATALCGVLSVGQLAVPVQKVEAAETAAVNLLTNGDFTEGMTGWSTYFYSSNCASAQINENYEFDMTVNYWDQWSYDGNSWYNISWQSILIQTVTIEAGKTYTFQFDGYASEPRTIQAGIKDNDAYRGYFDLTPTKTTYSKTFTAQSTQTQELQFLFGYMENEGAINPEGKHDVYISDVYLVEGDGSNIVNLPSIAGVDDDGEYITSVTPSVKYSKNYNAKLEYKENPDDEFSQIDYTVGDTISLNGYYRITVSDLSNESISVTKTFRIDSDRVDYSKEYYFIKSRSNGKVFESYGFKENGSIIQTTYAGKPSQLFTLEEVGSAQYKITSLSSNMVVAVNGETSNGAGIVQQTYTGSNFQKWIKVNGKQGYTILMNLGSGKVIDVPSASSSEGIQLDQYDNNDSNAQSWDIIKVDIDKVINGTQIPDTSTVDTWKTNSIIYPEEGKLAAAGPIFFKWYNNKSIGDVVSYEIIFDEEDIVTVTATDDDIMEYEWYNTIVSKHAVTLTAVMRDGTKVTADKRNFFVSKKGLGWGSLYRTDDMNLSWYYQWSMEESAGTSEDLQFVPMVWGNWGSEWLNNPENKKYKTVLGFNEPDFNEQSALTVSEAVNAWTDFSNSGLRVGSPCTAIGAYWSQDWFWPFMDAIEADDSLKVDFITIHCYVDSGDPDKLIELIDDTWNKWHKPIWITEFGVAKWGEGNDIWNNYTPGALDTVYNFMEKVIPALDSRPYVERYAWFPFDPNDEYGGASGIFNYDNGELNELGELYKSLGNPEGYATDDIEESIGDGIEINGYQISNTADGLRCVYSVESEISGQTVEEVGLIYGLADKVQAKDMYVGSTAEDVYSYAATQNGIVDANFSTSSTATSYAMTMKFRAGTAQEFNQSMAIRAYAKLADGKYVYTDVAEYSIYNVSKYLYDNVKMYSLAAHNYVYTNILKTVDPSYKEVDYNWSNILAPR